MGEPLSEDHKTALREHLVAAHGCWSSTVATWTGVQLFHGHVRAHESAPERLGPPHPVEVHEAPGEDDRISQILRESAVGRARGLLAELSETLAQISDPHPAFTPGTEPTAADNCGALLQMLEYGIIQIQTYLGGKP